MRRLAAVLMAGAMAAPEAVAAEPVGGCDPATLQGPQMSLCLGAAEKRSGDALDAVMKAALASIASRPGVFDTQRARWRNSLTESQAQWLHFRNTECQEVAPFEGQAASTNIARNRASAFEAKTICAIRMNDARAADIAARYPAP